MTQNGPQTVAVWLSQWPLRTMHQSPSSTKPVTLPIRNSQNRDA